MSSSAPSPADVVYKRLESNDELARTLRLMEGGTGMTKFWPRRRPERRSFYLRVDTFEIAWYPAGRHGKNVTPEGTGNFSFLAGICWWSVTSLFYSCKCVRLCASMR